MALSRKYRLVVMVIPVDASGNQIDQWVEAKHWKREAGEPEPVTGDLTVVGDWVVGRIAAIEGKTTPEEEDF